MKAIEEIDKWWEDKDYREAVEIDYKMIDSTLVNMLQILAKMLKSKLEEEFLAENNKI